MPEIHPILLGSVASPYSRKLRAVFRYRQLPYRFVHYESPESIGLPQARPMLMPTLIESGKDGELVPRTDTTPIIRELEVRTSERSVIPSDPAIAFIDALLEDYADEWLTKAMFHYRWAHDADIERAASILPKHSDFQQTDEVLDERGAEFSKRQVDRPGRG